MSNKCKQDCKIRYCGQIECECNKDDIVPYLRKEGIIACPPDFSNEGIIVIGKGKGNDLVQLFKLNFYRCDDISDNGTITLIKT